ncbi:MAG TPA: acetyl-CoA carboxylase biotin carboxyl carrier protein subunit [Rhodobacteraceae bacterium]|jgi:acetyl-CoA carboxylase biotin carboxyl carrier protein|nr:acetyl-CoA carboxylase biotin carboxyl carrier protein subunit [Paracoccaceae bacterium]
MAERAIVSETTGTVWKIEAAPGDRLNDGDTLLILESMKMELHVVVEDACTVVKILVAENESVREGQEIAILDED